MLDSDFAAGLDGGFAESWSALSAQLVAGHTTGMSGIEQRRKNADRTAQACLKVIEKDPAVVARLLQS